LSLANGLVDKIALEFPTNFRRSSKLIFSCGTRNRRATSPFRSYYRCTTTGCGVKKRVERSSDDPSIVVTTYEGQHTHPCPASSRASFGFVNEPGGLGHAGSSHFVLPHQHHHQPQASALIYNSNPPFVNSASNFMNTTSFGGFGHDPANRQGFGHEAMLRDNGLLQDIIVPSQVRKEEKEWVKL